MSTILVGLFRIGRDAEIRYTASGDAVASLSLAYDYGVKKDAKGYLPSQWIDAALWGKRAESLCQYLTKGTRVYAVIEDVHIETFEKRDGGQGHKLTGRVQNIRFAGGDRKDATEAGSGDDAPRPSAPRQQQEQRPAAPAKAAAGAQREAFKDDDIPF